jgi:hypothetical protein
MRFKGKKVKKSRGLLIVFLFLLLDQQLSAAEFNFSKLAIPTWEQMLLKRIMLTSLDSMICIDGIIDTTINDTPVYLLTQGENITIQVNRHNFKPILYRKTDKQGNMVEQIEYTSRQARVLIPVGHIDKTIAIKPDTYDKASLFYLFRALPFDQPGDKVYFSFIVINEKYAIHLVDMYVRIMDQQQVQVPAGLFSCCKVELGVAGLIGKLFVPQKWYYYFQQQPPHAFIKYEEPEKEIIELAKIMYH